jgi:hypothetical protein
LLTSKASSTRLSWFSGGTLLAAPAVFIAWFVWATFGIQICAVMDVRMFGGPAVALGIAGGGATAAAVMLTRRTTTLGIVLLTIGILECLGFGLEVFQALFCIPAPP